MIGQLNKRVTIQYKTRVSDDMGGFTTTWNDLATVWARIRPTGARELIQGMQPDIVVTHVVRIRHRDHFRGDYRLKFGQRYFDIKSIINPEEKNEWLDLVCKEAM